MLLFLHIPLIHLRVGTWSPVVLYGIIPGVLLLIYACLYGGDLRWPSLRHPLARHSYRTRSHNVAGVAYISDEAKEEIEYYEQRQDRFSYIREGSADTELLWHGNIDFRRRLTAFLGVGERSIRFFVNTTQAVRHAMQEILASLPSDKFGGDRPGVIVITDAEFPKIRSVVRESASARGIKVQEVAVRRAIANGEAVERVAQIILGAVSRDDVVGVCLSHVCWETGFVMPVAPILDSIGARERYERPFVLIDGAQAVGHIEVDAGILTRVHFYATSGHKWLLGQETLGILYRNPDESFCPPLTAELPVVESFATFATHEEEECEQAATIAAGPRISLNAALCDITASSMRRIASHNRSLAARFRQHLEVYPGYRIVPIRSPAAVVNLEVLNADVGKYAELLQTAGIIVGVIDAREDLPATMRICFHYYHDELDVDELVHKMIEVRRRLLGASSLRE